MAILTFEVKGQTLTVKSSIGRIVENSVNYLDYDINADWGADITRNLIISSSNISAMQKINEPIDESLIKAPGFQATVIGIYRPHNPNNNNCPKEIDPEGGLCNCPIKTQITTNPVFINISPSGATEGESLDEEIFTQKFADAAVTTLNSLSEKVGNNSQGLVKDVEDLKNNKLNVSTFNDEKTTLQNNIDSKANQSALSAHIENKVISVEANETSDEKYPTTKAVSDFVEEKIQKTASSLQEEITNHSTELNNNLVEVKNHIQSETSLLKNELSNTLKKNKKIEEGKIVSVDDVSLVEHEVSIRPHALMLGFYSGEEGTHSKSDVYRTLFFKQGEYKSFIFPENVNIIRKRAFGKFMTVGGTFYDNIKEIDSTIIDNATGFSFRLYKSNTNPWPSDYTIEAVRSDGSGIDYFSDRDLLSDKTIFTAGKNLFNEEKLGGNPSDEYREISLYLPKGDYILSSTRELYAKDWSGISKKEPTTDKSFSWEITVNESGIFSVNVRIYGELGAKVPWNEQPTNTPKLQIEKGSTRTPYEPYIGKEYSIDQDGFVKDVKSISPFMQAYSNHEGLPFSFEYNQDVNKAYDKLKTAIEKLGGTIE